MALGRLGEVLASDYKGPRAGFTEAHVLKAILTIGKLGSVGRGKLGSLLDLGQGEVRTLIKRLKDTGLISIEAEGCVLTDDGRREHVRILKVLPWSSEVDGTSLDFGRQYWALVVRARPGRVRNGIEQRDAAVKSGANGALTVRYVSGRFRVYSDNADCEPGGPSEPWTTIRSASPQEGDTVIVSAADGVLLAEYGALSAALTLL